MDKQAKNKSDFVPQELSTAVTESIQNTLVESEAAAITKSIQNTLQGLEEESLEFNSKGTIISNSEVDTFAHFTLERLPQLFSTEDIGEGLSSKKSMAELELREAIGEGGMGVIYNALQVPLQREVAVKTIHPKHTKPSVMKALLREAWVTGLLEHPNIVPVHLLGAFTDGSPMFVMKRIEGVPWSDLMHEPEHPLRQKSEKDHLAWNLDILLQVCNAVHFAHSKGILHRDLKPENVMIGSFGEIYLLDWGIAVSIRGDDALPICAAKDTKGIIGTPAYMAPEMATSQAGQINERTDVYLLGAILHEVMTGATRHLGTELMEVLFQAARSLPFDYGADVPQELGEICNRAMSVNPAKRFGSAEDFRKALIHFLQCRTSIELSDEALQTLDVLRLAIESLKDAKEPSHDTPSSYIPAEGVKENASKEESHLQVYELYYECKLSFQQALRIWKDNKRAEEGLQKMHALMAHYECEQGDLKAATLHVSSLQEPSEELKLRLKLMSEELSEHAVKIGQLRQLEHDTDLSVGKRTRAFISLSTGAINLPFFLYFSSSWGNHSFTYLHYTFLTCLFASGTLFFSVWARDTMRKTAVNRHIARGFWFFTFITVVQLLGAWLQKLDPMVGLRQTFLLAGLYIGVQAMMLSPRLLWGAAIYVLGFVGMLLAPSYTFDLAAFSNLSATAVIAIVWRPDSLSRSQEERT